MAGDAAKLAATLALDAGGARIEVQILLQQVLQQPRSWLLVHDDETLSAAQQSAYDALLQRRLAGEPLAYILGEREFFGLNFKVTPATLIPRPETELLVELALERLPSPQPLSRSREREERSGGRGGSVLDLGTGSGAIALSIAHARPAAEVTAVDASAAALEVAEHNAKRLAIGNVRFVRSDWFSELKGARFDLIVSNPPYVASGDPHLEKGDLPFEPLSALASGVDGLDDIRRIVALAPEHLDPGGWLLFEHGYDQAEQVRELLRQAGFGEVFSARDLAGIERVSGGQLA